MCGGLFEYRVTICPPDKLFLAAEERRKRIDELVEERLARHKVETLKRERREIAARKRSRDNGRRPIAIQRPSRKRAV